VPAKLLKRCSYSLGGVFKKLSYPFFRVVKTLKNKNSLSYNKLYYRNNSRKFFQVAVFTVSKDMGILIVV
jgi:hypothetical protein